MLAEAVEGQGLAKAETNPPVPRRGLSESIGEVHHPSSSLGRSHLLAMALLAELHGCSRKAAALLERAPWLLEAASLVAES